ncbi:MAG: PAS domain S-box protein [Candidatus Thorarchaeota archaeon]
MSASQGIPNIEVGYASVRGDDPFSVGVEVASKAIEDITDHPLSILLVHIKSEQSIHEVLQGISTITEDVPVMGSSSSPRQGNQDQIEASAFAIASPFIAISVSVGKGFSNDTQKTVAQVLKSTEVSKYFDPTQEEMWRELVGIGKTVFGIILATEDKENPSDIMTDMLREFRKRSENRIAFVGGATLGISGGKLGQVIYNRNAYSDAILLAIIETNLRVGSAMAHGFSDTGEVLRISESKGNLVTKVNNRPVIEFIKSRRSSTGVTLGIADAYGSCRHVLVDQAPDQKSLKMTKQFPKGTELVILESEGNDLQEAGMDAFNKSVIRGNIENPILTLVFSNIYRRAILSNNSVDELGPIRQMRPSMHVVGFDTGFEIGLSDDGINLVNNRSVSIITLGQNLSYAAEVAIQNKELLGRVSAAEASQRALLDLMPDAILATNRSLKITHWNPQAQQLLGQTRDSSMGLNVASILHPRLRWILENTTTTLQNKGEASSTSFEAEVIKADNSMIPVEVTVSFNPHQERYAFVIAIHDITEHKTSEAILDRERKAYKAIAEAAINTATIEDLCKVTLQGIMDTLGYDIGTIRLFNEKNQSLILTACSGINEDEVEDELFVRPFSESGYLGSDSAYKMESIFSPNTRKDANLIGRSERLEKMGIEAVVIWPLKSSTGSILGVLNIASYTSKDDTEESRIFFEVLANMFVTVLERRITSEALAESEVKIRTILQSMRDLVFVFDGNDNYAEFYYSDPSLLYGDPDEIKGRHLSEALPPSVANEIIRTAKRVRETKKPQNIDYCLEIHGRKLWFSANISLHEDGESVVSVSRDITARKEAESALARRLEYEKALANISQSLLMEREEGKEAIRYALQVLREITSTARVYIFENTGDDVEGLSIRLMEESAAPEILEENVPYQERIVEYRTGHSRWSKELSQGKTVAGRLSDFPHGEKPPMIDFRSKSVLMLPIWVQGKWYGFMGFDDTGNERNWTDDEIRLLRTATEMISNYIGRISAEAELRSSLRDLELYSSILRHDFANDIMLILNQIEASEILGLDEQQLIAIMETSKIATDRMAQVLSVFRAENIQSINRVGDLLEVVVEQAEKAHPTIKITLQIGDDLGNAQISGGRLLPMVFSNLVRNAEEYAGENAELTITVNAFETNLEFLVDDNGPGVDPSIRDSLFQIGASTSGGGLGLYLCKRVIEGYSGTMEYVDTEDVGARFRITLPIA